MIKQWRWANDLIRSCIYYKAEITKMSVRIKNYGIQKNEKNN